MPPNVVQADLDTLEQINVSPNGECVNVQMGKCANCSIYDMSIDDIKSFAHSHIYTFADRRHFHFSTFVAHL